jgi:hypothetical protein
VVATNITATTFTDTNVTSGQTYYYVVSAVNPVGLTSANSTQASATPNGPPATPSHLQAITSTNRAIALSWDATPNTSGYFVNRSIISGGPYQLVASPLTNDFTDTAPVNGVTYFYTVSAVNAQGDSPGSSEVAAVTGDSPAWTRAAGPVGYWRLDEAGGTNAVDASGNGLDGTYEPQVTLDVPGVPNPPYFGFQPGDPAASFDGQPNSWVSLPGLNLNSANVTFTAWIYPSTATQYGSAGLIFCRDGLGTVSGFNYTPAGTQLGYTWNNDGGTYGWNSGLTPPANQWSFIALVVTPTNVVVYLDSTNGQFSARSTHPQTSSAFAGETRIGNDAYDPYRTFNGSVAHVAVYNSALPASRIAALYQGGAGLYYGPALVNTWNGSQLALSWPFGGSLLQATNLSGPWVTNSGAPPVTVTPDQPQMFFRVP